MSLPLVSLGFIIQAGFFYVRRSWRSTLVLAAMVFTAVGALVFLSALAVGTNDAMIRNSVGLFSGHVTGDHIAPGDESRLAKIAGVKYVLPRRQRPAWLKKGENGHPVVLMGIRPDLEKTAVSLWKKTIDGRFPAKGDAALYLSEFESRQLNARVGDRVHVGFDGGPPDVGLTVCGIYRTGIAFLDQGIAFCPVDVFPGPGSLESVAVFLEEGVDPERLLEENAGKLTGIHLSPWTQFMPDLNQLIDLNYVSMGIVMMLVFCIVSLGISCAFIIFIVKNLREHGIMKAMGIAPYESALLILTQVMVLTVFAACAGAAAGALAVWGLGTIGIDLTSFTSHNQYFVVSGIIYPRLTSYSLAVPPLMAVAFGCLGALWPMGYVIRSRAADVLRSI